MIFLYDSGSEHARPNLRACQSGWEGESYTDLSCRIRPTHHLYSQTTPQSEEKTPYGFC